MTIRLHPTSVAFTFFLFASCCIEPEMYTERLLLEVFGEAQLVNPPSKQICCIF